MSRPLDVIALRGLSARAVHGVLPEEHVAPQPFVVDLALWVDGRDAARSDDIAETVSYAEVADVVSTIVKGPAVRLIETLAHRIADAIVSMERVHGVEVTVHKPEAPIRQAFADVSVTVRAGRCGEAGGAAELTRDVPEAPARPGARAVPEARYVPEIPARPGARVVPEARLPQAPARPVVRVVLALGGNIGDAPKTLADAVERLIDDPRIDVLDVSPLLRTMPVLAPGQAPQDDYWNAVVLASTALAPREVLALAHELEASAKRERLERWGARTLDVDLIDYAGIVMSDADLTLPHPRARVRAFVLAPWSIIDPQARLGGERVAELLARAPDIEGIIDAVDDWLGDPGTIMAESDALIAQALEENAVPAPPVAHPPAPPLGSPRDRTVQKSRLDLVPEESRLGLAPSEGSLDLVWRQLWERWSAPIDVTQTRASTAPALTGSTASPRFTGSTAPRPLAASAVSPQLAASAAEGATRTYEDAGSRAEPAFEEAPTTTAAPAEGAEADAPKRRPRWLPLLGHKEEHADARASASAGAETPVPSGTRTASTAPGRAGEPPAAPRPSRTLPTWDFAGARVRIVDEASALDAPAEQTSGSHPLRRSIVDPGLPEDALRGPVADSELTRTGLLRKVVVRPSVSGPITVTREQEGR